MIDVTYQSTLAFLIGRLLPEYKYSEKLGEMLCQINQTEAKHLYKLARNYQRDQLQNFIETYI